METIHLLILIIGVGLGFYVQSVVGFAAALVALPIILNVLNIQESVALMSIFFLIFSIISIYKNWKLIDKKMILEMSIGIIAGLLLGIYILKFGSPIILKKALGIFIILFVGYSFIKKRKIESIKKLGPLFGFIGGIFSGLFSTGGPPIVFYIYNKLDKSNIVRATIIGTLGLTDFLRFPFLIFSGILTDDIFLISSYVLPFFLLSLYLGYKTHSRINENIFKNVLMIFLLLSGISLLVR